MMGKLREKPGSTGLITANGYYLTKHAAGVYSTAPRDTAEVYSKPAKGEAAPSAQPVQLALEAQGKAVVETYTVIHDPAGDPQTGIVIGRLEDERRFIAFTPADSKLLENMATTEVVGMKGEVGYHDGHNIFKPI